MGKKWKSKFHRVPYLIPFHWSREAQNSVCFRDCSTGMPPLFAIGILTGKCPKTSSSPWHSSDDLIFTINHQYFHFSEEIIGDRCQRKEKVFKFFLLIYIDLLLSPLGLIVTTATDERVWSKNPLSCNNQQPMKSIINSWRRFSFHPWDIGAQ